ncbi:hypothetical protein THAOC_14143 [Thalassiosira oceanica]|uniref:Uncharacterized protein n=1 Tax=Thalassiosira oceanica TaxID=159749 RepID=K0SVP0_THAOC|nr:hypothetical protein THAOC_14143 [Thalassiosira oceanica]|eukprot:EJK65056.1 hypothetical protein THAOC_14143 [Thalassiosira oceanica]
MHGNLSRETQHAEVIRGFEPGDRAGSFETVNQVAAAEVPAPKASPFRFEFSAEAADHNTTALERYDFDFAKVLDDSPGSHNRDRRRERLRGTHHSEGSQET